MIIRGKADNNKKDGKLVYFGPESNGDITQLKLPTSSTRLVDYEEHGFSIEYFFTFDGKRLSLSMMTVIRVTNPNGITTKALTELQIPKVMQELVYSYNPSLDISARRKDRTTEHLVQAYLAEYACSGSPRRAVIERTGWSRSNANFHLKKLAKAELIPASSE